MNRDIENYLNNCEPKIANIDSTERKIYEAGLRLLAFLV